MPAGFSHTLDDELVKMAILIGVFPCVQANAFFSS